MKYLAIERCQEHGVYAILLAADYDCVGIILSGGCRKRDCHRNDWERVAQWPVTAIELSDLVNELECAADETG